jgi:DNA-binding NarL/FixJ family response regulator
MSATILIVDDDADTRAMLRTFVAAEGYEARTAASGNEALRLLEEESATDLILLDAVMPGLDGFETCRRIKAGEDTRHVPVIFMTGLSEPRQVVRGLDAGGVDYVTKPLELDTLAARIRVHLGNARKARSALTALDTAGARLLSCNEAGEVIWAAPETGRLLQGLDPAAMAMLGEGARALARSGGKLPVDMDGERYILTMVGRPAPGESLFKLVRSIEGSEPKVLQQAFGLTAREADVLLWTARGKSNKDMSEILRISARTVNKHLEQIFIKIGVENRASAAAAATQVLAHAEGAGSG